MLLFYCWENSGDTWWRAPSKTIQNKALNWCITWCRQHVVNFAFCRWENRLSCSRKGLLKMCAPLFKYAGLLDICSTASAAHPCHIPPSSTRHSAHCWHLQAYLCESNCILYEEIHFCFGRRVHNSSYQEWSHTVLKWLWFSGDFMPCKYTSFNV